MVADHQGGGDQGGVEFVYHRVCPFMALRVVPCLAQISVAIGGGADMDDRAAMDDGDVNGPMQTWPAAELNVR